MNTQKETYKKLVLFISLSKLKRLLSKKLSQHQIRYYSNFLEISYWSLIVQQLEEKTSETCKKTGDLCRAGINVEKEYPKRETYILKG